MSKFQRAMIIGGSVLAVGATIWGVRMALRSPMFTIQVVEVEDQAEDAPVDSDTITTLAAVPVGRENLFDLELGSVEKRILAHDWVRQVRLSKRFPQTVSIAVSYREPRAILQGARGGLSYIDQDGQPFSHVNLTLGHDLPILTGFDRGTPAESTRRILDGLKIVEIWNRSSVASQAQLAALAYDSERGFRAVAVYGMITGGRARTWIDLGLDPLPEIEAQLDRLFPIFRHLASHQLAARQIWANSGKKIVVKITHGS